MADTVTNLGLLTLAQEFRSEIVRQVNRKTVTLRLLRCIAGAGKNISWATEFSGQHFEFYSEGADAANFSSDTQGQAVLNWGLARSNFHLTELAMDAAATTSTPDNHAIWARNLVNASAATAAGLNVALFNGAGTGSLIAGLGVAIGSNSNVYAGVDKSTTALWKPYYVDPGAATPISLAQIRTDIMGVLVQGGQRPDVALCSPAVFNKVVGLFDATRRYVQDIMTPAGTVRLNSSAAALEVDGVMFVCDKDMTAVAEGTIYYLNLDHVWLEYLPSVAERAMMAMNMSLEANDGYGSFPLGMRYHVLAKNGPSERAECLTTIQLVCDRPNTHGVRKNVDVS